MPVMIKILYTLKKEFLLITRDVHAVAILFVMPAMFIMIMSLAMRDLFESHSGVSIAVLTVNRDNGQDAEQFVKAIESLTTFKLRPLAKDATNEQIRDMMFAEDYKFALILREGFSNRINHGIGPKDEKMLELLVNSSVTAQTQMVLKGGPGGQSRKASAGQILREAWRHSGDGRDRQGRDEGERRKPHRPQIPLQGEPVVQGPIGGPAERAGLAGVFDVLHRHSPLQHIHL